MPPETIFLEKLTTSASMPKCSWHHIFPVAPPPVCTWGGGCCQDGHSGEAGDMMAMVMMAVITLELIEVMNMAVMPMAVAMVVMSNGGDEDGCDCIAVITTIDLVI